MLFLFEKMKIIVEKNVRFFWRFTILILNILIKIQLFFAMQYLVDMNAHL